MKKLIVFILTNFGPLVGFYLVNQFWGFKEAVIVSIIFIFGVADRVIQEPFLLVKSVFG